MAVSALRAKRNEVSHHRSWRWVLVILPIFAIVACLLLRLAGLTAITFSNLLLAAVLVIASVTDMRERKIPNWLTYSGVLWGIGLNLLANGYLLPVATMEAALGTVGIIDSLLGALVCFSLMLIGYLASGTGAGDVKLLAAVGALGGIAFGVSTLLWGYIIAGTAVILWQIAMGNSWSLAASLGRRVGSGLAPGWVAPPTQQQEAFLKRPFPLAAAFATGALVTALGGGFFGGGSWQ